VCECENGPVCVHVVCAQALYVSALGLSTLISHPCFIFIFFFHSPVHIMCVYTYISIHPSTTACGGRRLKYISYTRKPWCRSVPNRSPGRVRSSHRRYTTVAVVGHRLYAASGVFARGGACRTRQVLSISPFSCVRAN